MDPARTPIAVTTRPPTGTSGTNGILMEFAPPVAAETYVVAAPVEPLVPVAVVVCDPVLVVATSYHEVGHEYVVGNEYVFGHEKEAGQEYEVAM